MDPLELIYYAGYRLNTARDLGRQQRLAVPVLSVGNITTGGTGKTPAVIALAHEAQNRGLNPCVLTRGYGGRLRGPVFVSAENYARDVGDEPLLIAMRLQGVPIVKCPDRYEGGMFAIENLEQRPGLFILDDGFQHRKLYRDMDVVLVSALDPFGRRKMLPFGRLREPLDELVRSDVIVITKADLSDDEVTGQISRELRLYNSDAPVFVSSHGPSSVLLGAGHHESLTRGDSASASLDWLRGRRVFAFCAIAEPGAFLRSIKEAEGVVAGSMFFRDHHVFTRRDISEVMTAAATSGAEWIITTEKDIMRLRALDALPSNIAALAIDFRIHQKFYDYVFDNLRGPDAKIH